MNKSTTTEDLLAEIIEQNNKQQKDFADVKKSFDGLSEEISKLTTQLNPTRKPVKFEEMIPRKDAEERAKYLVRLYNDMQTRYVQVKADNGELETKIRYFASNQWEKRLFRWLFIKRHAWFFLVFLIYEAMASMLIYDCMSKNDEIARLEGADLKYRYIRALHVCPRAINYVDSIFEMGSSEKIDSIHKNIVKYENTIKLKCDSVVKAENKKRERYR